MKKLANAIPVASMSLSPNPSPLTHDIKATQFSSDSIYYFGNATDEAYVLLAEQQIETIMDYG